MPVVSVVKAFLRGQFSVCPFRQNALSCLVQIEIPSKVPAMLLPNVTLFPGMMLPLYIFEPRYRKMLADVLAGDRMFAVVMTKPMSMTEEPVEVGCLGLIRACVENKDGTSNLFLHGITRLIVKGQEEDSEYPLLHVQPVAPPQEATIKSEALALKVKELVSEHLGNDQESPPEKLAPTMPDVRQQLAETISAIESPAQLADMVTYALIGDPARKQELLETLSIEDRLDKLILFLLE